MSCYYGFEKGWAFLTSTQCVPPLSCFFIQEVRSTLRLLSHVPPHMQPSQRSPVFVRGTDF